MLRTTYFILAALLNLTAYAQLSVGRDTITVIENGKVLKAPWAGGLNFCQFSKIDLNFDGKKDIVAFDKVNSFAYGVIRCFINTGTTGQTAYYSDGNYTSKFPAVDSWVYFYDYNNDGKEDLITYVLGGIKIYQNTSSLGNLNFQIVKPRLKSDFNPTGPPTIGNIYSSPQSVPGFADIDNDGDMDILTFSSTGYKIEYHKNQSKELYAHSDSLVFDMVDYCWGDISENNCAVTLNDCPIMKQFEATNNAEKIMHSGSCLMCFDRDNDGDQDLIMGDISCPEILYMENGGSSSNAHITDTTKLYPNFPLKASTQVIKLNNFPCTYYLDVDNDGKKDLIASPNEANSENYQSVLLYKNTGSTVNEFQFVKSNFLQDEMIEVGEGAYPVLFDNDNDGLLDLLIGNMGYYQGTSNKTRLTYYKNIGTLSQPSYSLITRDFAGISTYTYSMYGLVPAIGDIDGDGDKDMILGDTYGKIHWYENTAGAGNPCNFSNFKYNFFGITTISSNAYPQIIDVDRDGVLDLLIGMQNGRIAYYRNTGTTASPAFSIVTNTLGNVYVRGNPSVYLTGNCSPFMFDDGGTYKLLCGSTSGRIFYYDNIDGNLSGNFNRLDTNVNKIYEGMQSALQYTDINNDGLRDLITSNYAGGLCFFSSKNPIGIKEADPNLSSYVLAYPNPAQNTLTVQLNEISGMFSVELKDLLGKTVYRKRNNNSPTTISTSQFAKGVYILTVDIGKDNLQTTLNKKIIIE